MDPVVPNVQVDALDVVTHRFQPSNVLGGHRRRHGMVIIVVEPPHTIHPVEINDGGSAHDGVAERVVGANGVAHVLGMK